MSDVIIDQTLKQHAQQMLNYANLVTKLARTLMLNENRLHKKAEEIAGSVYKRNHVVRVIHMYDLEEIEKMGMLIAYDAEVLLNGKSNIGPSTKTVDASYQGRRKAICYPEKTIKAQALLLQGVRHKHARKTVVLVRKIGTVVKCMKKLESKVIHAIKKALRTAGQKMDNLKGQGFEIDAPTFRCVLEKVKDVLSEAQAVADASVPPPLPSDE